MPVQRQIRHQPLELGVFLAQLPELAQSQSGVLLLPDVVGRFADSMFPEQVGDPNTALGLVQRAQNLLLCVTPLRHPRPPSRSENDIKLLSLNLSPS